MKLFYKLSDDYNKNYIIKYQDGSFCGYNSYFDFQIELMSNGVFTLNFDFYTMKCQSCEGYILNNKYIQYENIIIDKFSNGDLCIELEELEEEAHSNPKMMFKYLLNGEMKYDINKTRISLGDINGDIIIRFGEGQYASFKDNKLIGLIVDFKIDDSPTNNISSNSKPKIKLWKFVCELIKEWFR